MKLEPQVTFKNVAPSDVILDQIHSDLGKLAEQFARIVSCRMVLERPRHPHRNGDHFRVDLVLTLPGAIEVAVNRDPPESGREDPVAAISNAFEIAARRIAHVLGRRQAAAWSASPAFEGGKAPRAI